MNDFNYEKAWFVLAKPTFLNLNTAQLNAHSKVRALIGELNQDTGLNIPLTPAIESILDELQTKELAELSNCSMFVGHWQPGKVESLFDNQRGESWKVTNVCDQILRKRLYGESGKHRTEIHDGKLRVTFSSRECWLWDEFALATKENLQIFKDCGLPFGEDTLQESASKLKAQINDLWGDVDTFPDNKDYKNFLENKKKWELEKIKIQKRKKILDLVQDIKNAEKELKAFTWLIENNVDYDNCILYNHSDTFSFGWRDLLSTEEREILTKQLKDFPYKWEFNKRR